MIPLLSSSHVEADGCAYRTCSTLNGHVRAGHKLGYAAVALFPLLLLTSCEGVLSEAASSSADVQSPPILASDSMAPPSDGGMPRSDWGNPSSKPDDPNAHPNPCNPLPKGCACANACIKGVCDNSKCASANCSPIPGVSYTKLSINRPDSRDMKTHGDINLLLRQKKTVDALKGLIELNGPTDYTPGPQLFSLFADNRVPVFANIYQIEYWDWGCNCPKGYIQKPEVSLAGMKTAPGEIINTPKTGYHIGDGFTAIVLYASAEGTITIKYTREDNVVKGYTIHIGGICVDPNLLKLYQQCNDAGRTSLPALKNLQPIGRAVTSEIQVAVRDTGSWMDPRGRKDWWQGK